MKPIFVLPFLLLLLVDCSHGKLMRCGEQVGADYWFCPSKVEGAYYMCSQPKDVLRCEEVR